MLAFVEVYLESRLLTDVEEVLGSTFSQRQELGTFQRVSLRNSRPGMVSFTCSRGGLTYPEAIDCYERCHQHYDSNHKRCLFCAHNFGRRFCNHSSSDSNDGIQRRHYTEDPAQRGSGLNWEVFVELGHHPAFEDAVHQSGTRSSKDTANEEYRDIVCQKRKTR